MAAAPNLELHVGLALREVDLRDQNPWWRGEPMRPLPPHRRWLFPKLRERLLRPLAPVLMVRGPRQVGKTTLQLQLIDDLLSSGVDPTRILRAQFDDAPRRGSYEHDVTDLARWFEEEILAEPFNAAARRGQPAFLFLDEVQNLKSWDVQLKSLVDRADVRVVVTGSSALRIGLGRDSLAGRIQRFDLGTLRLGEIATLRSLPELVPVQPENGWEAWSEVDFWHHAVDHGDKQADARDVAFAAFAERGAYPRSHVSMDVPWPEVADQLNETVVRRVIQHDLRIGDRGPKRDPQLLEEVFRLACRYAGRSPTPQVLAREVQQALAANVGIERIRHYVDVLDSSLLIRKVAPLEIRLKRSKGAPKICLCDHGIRAAWLQEQVPLVPSDLDRNQVQATLACDLVESIVGYYLASITGLDLAHLPERPGQPEVDYVVTLGDRRLPIEVKYQRRPNIGQSVAGLCSFLDTPANNANVGLLVTRSDTSLEIDDPRIVVLPLPDLLLVR